MARISVTPHVRLATRADGLTIEQGDVTTTILWEELPAWIDAAVAHNTANRDPFKPWWRHGNLAAEIHFRRDERNQAIRTAMDALAEALRETVPPTDEQLAEARDRYAPPAAAPATATEAAAAAEDAPAEESAPEESAQLPEDAVPVPGAEGYHYTEEGRTVRLYTEAGEEVGTAKWSYSKYRYLGDVQGDTVRGTEDGATVAKRMANHHAVVYGDQVYRPTLDDQGRDPVWILHNGSDTLVFGVSPEDDTARAAMWTGGGFKESRKVGGWYLPRTWKEPTRRQRVDDAVRVLAVAGRTVTVHTSREERQQPSQRPARLPELEVTAPNLDEVPQFFKADPFTDQDDLRDVEALEAAYDRWSQHPTVRAYLSQDNDARPDGFGAPDNPIAELHIAYHRARLALREPVPGGPDEIVRRVYGVAAWCQALEPAVERDLLDPLQDVYAAAHGLAARAQATIAALTAEQTAAAEDAPAAAQQESGSGDQPDEPAPAPSETTSAAAAKEQTEHGPAAPGALTDPVLRGLSLEAIAAAALAAPQIAQAARANDVNNFTFVLAAWVDEWVTEEWADVPPGDWPDWVRAYFRSGDNAVQDRNGLHAELAGPVYAQLRTTEAEPDPAPTPDPADAEQQTTEPEPEPAPNADAEPEEQLDLFGSGNDSAPAPQQTPPGPAPDAAPNAPVHEPVPAQSQSAPADLGEEQLDLFAATFPEQPTTPEQAAPPADPVDTTTPETEAPREGSLGLVDGETLTYRGHWDGRYEITLPGTSYLLFLPSIEYRRTGFAVASNEDPDAMSPKRLRRFEDAEEIMPWVRAHASKQETGYVFREGAWSEAPQAIAPEPPTEAAEPAVGIEDPSAPQTFTETFLLAADAPATAESPELDVVLPDVELATLDAAEPYETDEDAQADINRLSVAFARWDALPIVQRFYEADRQQRPDGQRIPTNPVAQLAAAYRDAERMLREGPAVSPDDLVLEVHTVAVWSGVLEPVVDEDLRGPLRQVREAAALLASRSRATVAAFEAELATLTANSAEQSTAAPESAAADTEPAEQPPADADDAPETGNESGPDAPAAAAEGLGEPPAGTPPATDTEPESVTDDTPAPDPQEAPEPPAVVDDAPGDTAADTAPGDTAADSDPAPDGLPVPQDAPEPAGAEPDEGMHEARREASFLEQGRPQTTDGDQQTPESDTAAAPSAPAPAPAEEDAPSDETARDASEEPTMTTPPIPETTDVPDEPISEEPPAPRRYFETVPLAGDSGYQVRLSGLDGQRVDSGDVLRGDLIIATIHPSSGGGWYARLADEGLLTDVTSLADTPEGAAVNAAVMYSAFTSTPYGPPPGAAIGDETRQRVDVLRADLRDAAVQHRDAVASAAARAYPDFEQNEYFRELVSSLDGLAAAVSDAHGSQQMTHYLDGVQRAVNNWGGALPADPGDPERRQLAFPLAHLLYDSRRLQDQVQATLAAVHAEQAAVREQAAPTVPGPEVQPAATPADTEEPTESQSPKVPDSQTSETAREETPAELADAPGPESPDGAGPEDDGPALDAAVDGIRRALEDALQAAQPEASVQPGELPLWTGTEAPPADTAVTKSPAGPLDVRAEFQAVLEAWGEHVPPENGTAQDLVAELDADLATLQRAFAEAVAPAAPAAPPAATDQDAAASDESVEAAAPPSVPQQAADVNAALQQADTHATALQDLPEWQKIQTVRGAFGHLFRVMKERAGERFDRLMGDHRVGEFFRKVSIAACDKVAGLAQAAADRLRRRGEGNGSDAPAADALRGVADAATGYASPGGGHSGPPPASRDAASVTVDIPAMRQIGEALARPLPAAKDGGGARVSAAAARGKSTTHRGTKKPNGTAKKPGAAAEQAGHLRRGGAEPQQQNHKPTQR